MSDVVKFPTSGFQRAKNRRGKRSVSCMVSDRFFHFQNTCGLMEDGTYIFVDVMNNGGDKPRKITSVCVTLEELKQVIAYVEATRRAGR